MHCLCSLGNLIRRNEQQLHLPWIDEDSSLVVLALFCYCLIHAVPQCWYWRTNALRPMPASCSSSQFLCVRYTSHCGGVRSIKCGRESGSNIAQMYWRSLLMPCKFVITRPFTIWGCYCNLHWLYLSHHLTSFSQLKLIKTPHHSTMILELSNKLTHDVMW